MTPPQRPSDLIKALRPEFITRKEFNDGAMFDVISSNITAWDDLRIEPVARTSGTNSPAFEQWFTNGAGSRGVYLYSFDDAVVASEKELHFTQQMPHSWAGTGIYIHVHWIGNLKQDTAAPRWGLEYTWADINTVFGNTGIIYATGMVGGDVNITDFKHYVTSFAVQNPTASQNDISSVLIGRIFRNSSNAADTYTTAGNKCGLLYIDTHYEINSIGSREEFTK